MSKDLSTELDPATPARTEEVHQRWDATLPTCGCAARIREVAPVELRERPRLPVPWLPWPATRRPTAPPVVFAAMPCVATWRRSSQVWSSFREARQLARSWGTRTARSSCHSGDPEFRQVCSLPPSSQRTGWPRALSPTNWKPPTHRRTTSTVFRSTCRRSWTFSADDANVCGRGSWLYSMSPNPFRWQINSGAGPLGRVWLA